MTANAIWLFARTRLHKRSIASKVVLFLMSCIHILVLIISPQLSALSPVQKRLLKLPGAASRGMLVLIFL